MFPHNIHHRQTAFELYTKEKKNYLFNVYETNILNDIFILFKILNPNCSALINKLESFNLSGLLNKWVEGKISNFEYLMALNKFSGRSFNDLSQYPIFPWILSNYKSKNLDLNDSKNYRDLSLPIGALNQNRLNNFLERMKNMSKTEKIKPFLYGTHYSNPPTILFYLIRLEPFSSLGTQLQNGKFDCPDRMFSSISDCWDSCINNSCDLKELIPEFFYFPDFLKNLYYKNKKIKSLLF